MVDELPNKEAMGRRLRGDWSSRDCGGRPRGGPVPHSEAIRRLEKRVGEPWDHVLSMLVARFDRATVEFHRDRVDEHGAGLLTDFVVDESGVLRSGELRDRFKMPVRKPPINAWRTSDANVFIVRYDDGHLYKIRCSYTTARDGFLGASFHLSKGAPISLVFDDGGEVECLHNGDRDTGYRYVADKRRLSAREVRRLQRPEARRKNDGAGIRRRK